MATLREALAHDAGVFLDAADFGETIEIAEFGGPYREIVAVVRRGGPEPRPTAVGETWTSWVEIETRRDAAAGVERWSHKMRARVDGLEFVFARALETPREFGMIGARFERDESDVEIAAEWRAE